MIHELKPKNVIVESKGKTIDQHKEKPKEVVHCPGQDQPGQKA